MGRLLFALMALYLVVAVVTACQLSIPKEITIKVEQPVTPTDPTIPQPIPSTLTYKKNIANVLSGYCLSCHNGPGGKGGVDLSSYSSVMAHVTPGDEKSPVCDQVKRELMPPGSPLSKASIDAICNWVKQGAKES